MDLKSFGYVFKNDIRGKRRARNLTQQQLADLTGLSKNTIANYELGVYNPTAENAIYLCVALCCDFSDLFWIENDQEVLYTNFFSEV